jgi:hypothetical protein
VGGEIKDGLEGRVWETGRVRGWGGCEGLGVEGLGKDLKNLLESTLKTLLTKNANISVNMSLFPDLS